MSDDNHNKKNPYPILWELVKCIMLISITIVVAYKILISPISFQVDFPVFLSIVLAFFSVGLSALFYFKATATSNTFYDNTYKFTKDIAELLVRIESGFGEKLRHLDEGYSSMRDRFDSLPGKGVIQETKKDLKKEEEELEVKIKERDKVIEDLFNRAQLQEGEKERFIKKLKEEEDALQNARQEIQILKNRLFQYLDRNSGISDKNIFNYMQSHLIPQLNVDFVKTASSRMLKNRFKEIKNQLPEGFVMALQRFGLTDENGDLTYHGANIIRDMANK
jgi:hypothetical protein